MNSESKSPTTFAAQGFLLLEIDSKNKFSLPLRLAK
jgi:hypothetical protein